MLARTLLLVLLSSIGATSFAAADKKCNGDVPLRRCTAITPSKTAAVPYQMVKSDEEVCAALTWQTGLLGATGSTQAAGELTNIEHYAEVAESAGAFSRVYESERIVDAKLCWELAPIKSKAERPRDIDDAKKQVSIRCAGAPKELFVALPHLIDTAKASIDRIAKQIDFLDMSLMMVPHFGSAYLGVAAEFAVTIHKETGAYKVVLPDGRSFAGTCEYLGELNERAERVQGGRPRLSGK